MNNGFLHYNETIIHTTTELAKFPDKPELFVEQGAQKETIPSGFPTLQLLKPAWWCSFLCR